MTIGIPEAPLGLSRDSAERDRRFCLPSPAASRTFRHWPQRSNLGSYQGAQRQRCVAGAEKQRDPFKRGSRASCECAQGWRLRYSALEAESSRLLLPRVLAHGRRHRCLYLSRCDRGLGVLLDLGVRSEPCRSGRQRRAGGEKEPPPSQVGKTGSAARPSSHSSWRRKGTRKRGGGLGGGCGALRQIWGGWGGSSTGGLRAPPPPRSPSPSFFPRPCPRSRLQIGGPPPSIFPLYTETERLANSRTPPTHFIFLPCLELHWPRSWVEIPPPISRGRAWHPGARSGDPPPHPIRFNQGSGLGYNSEGSPRSSPSPRAKKGHPPGGRNPKTERPPPPPRSQWSPGWSSSLPEVGGGVFYPIDGATPRLRILEDGRGGGCPRRKTQATIGCRADVHLHTGAYERAEAGWVWLRSEGSRWPRGKRAWKRVRCPAGAHAGPGLGRIDSQAAAAAAPPPREGSFGWLAGPLRLPACLFSFSLFSSFLFSLSSLLGRARSMGGCPVAPSRSVGFLGLAWLLLLLLLLLLASAWGKTIRYHTYEEDPPGTVIGTLADEWPLKGASGGERTFRLVKAPGNGSLVRGGASGTGSSAWARSGWTGSSCAATAGGPAEAPCLLAFDVLSLGGPAGAPAPSRLLHVELEVRDLNDHAPRFPQPLVALEVSESAAPGTRLPLPLAHDPDAGSNGLQSFALSPGSPFGLEARSRADGLRCAELVLLRGLDREAQAGYRLELVAADGGSPPRSGTATLSVRVLDANDNAPAFPRGALLTLELPEDAPPGAPLLELAAADADEGANGQLLYAWGSQVGAEARRLFSLDPLSGRLALRAPVDHERQRAYELDVQVSDRGASPLSASCKVLVRLLDVNDNAPEVAISALAPGGGGGGNGPAVASVSEAAAAQSLVALVSTSDSDAGANGQVRCALLAAPHQPFALQRAYDAASYLVLTTGPLDRERVAEYNLTLVAEDLGSPPAKTVRSLTVRARYEVALPENNPPGAYLTTVGASDPDFGSNSKVSYRLLDGQIMGASISTYVSVDPATGAIYALRTFNYEILKEVELSIQATDGGSPPLSSTALVKVRVMDQNDNAPVITSPALTNGSLEIGVSSRASRDSLVVHVKARDADEGVNAELSFAFSEDPQQQERSLDLFAINQKTGEVTLRRSLSEEQLGQVYPLLLTVVDNGLPPLSTTVVVNFLVTSSLPPSSGQESVAKPSSWEDQPLQWDVPLIVIIVLAGSCTLLLVAIITIATTCNRRKKEKKVVLEEPLDTSHLEQGHQDGSASDGALNPSSPHFDVHSFPSKSSFVSPEPSPDSEDIPVSEHSRETTSLYDSQNRLRGANAESYTSTPSYGKEPAAPVTMWKGHSFNTLSGREGDKFSGKDSGKGDSDFNDSDSDISGDALKKDLITHMQNGLWACTAECKLLGHSDRCWSPSCAQTNPHTSPHPKTQLSTFCRTTSLPRDTLHRDHFYPAQLPKTVGLQSVYEKVLHRDYDRTVGLRSPPHPGRLPDLQEISVPLYESPSHHYLGSPSETSKKV
ncbi:protocadherin-8 [Crotalus adamanteus]|uniref:Protocadherin-8 n=1 Tax=Crotalus adamanteus TaxID=8729 RepID=A0AAW1BIJ9_CROAD